MTRSGNTYLLQDVIGGALIRHEYKLVIWIRLLCADIIALLIFGVVLDVTVACHAARDQSTLSSLPGTAPWQIISHGKLVRGVNHGHIDLVVGIALEERALIRYYFVTRWYCVFRVCWWRISGACERWTGCVVTVAYFDASGVIICAASLSSFFFFENRDGMLFYNLRFGFLC